MSSISDQNAEVASPVGLDLEEEEKEEEEERSDYSESRCHRKPDPELLRRGGQRRNSQRSTEVRRDIPDKRDASVSRRRVSLKLDHHKI